MGTKNVLFMKYESLWVTRYSNVLSFFFTINMLMSSLRPEGQPSENEKCDLCETGELIG